MLTKIHFDSNTVIIAPAGDAETARYTNGPDVLRVDGANASSARQAIDFVASGEKRTVVLSTNDTDDVLNGFKRELVLIRAAGGLIQDGDLVLLIFRRGRWDLPKGKLDPGEDLETCALREINEETGLKTLSAKSFLVTTYHTYFHKHKHVLKESNWFLVQGDRNDRLQPQTDEDIEQCLWVNRNDLQPYMDNAHESIVDVCRYAGLVS